MPSCATQRSREDPGGCPTTRCLLKHLHSPSWQGRDPWVLSSSLAKHQPFTFDNVYVYNIKNISKLEEYLAPDGSLRATITLNAKLPPKLVEPDETIAYNSPFRKLLPSGYLSDVTLRITDGLEDGNNPSYTLSAHKLVLSCRSRYFKSMFTSTLREAFSSSSPCVINIPDFSIQTIKSLLEFMYTGLLHHHQPKNLEARLDLVRAADSFLVKGLNRYIANEILMHDLKPFTALAILEYESTYKMYVTLTDRVGDWIRSRWDELKAVDEFRESLEQADPELVAELLD
ncbi:hypothetical protein HDV00_007397 [Rhizophlyctis rosea]|nr:hypothetical protein HDV00_007397 [Rhizophlyctis rosea]